MTCHCIRDLINNNSSLKVKVIIAHIIGMYGYIISYRKSWIANIKAIESLYPQWLLMIKTSLPGKIIDLQTFPTFSNEGIQLSNMVIFHCLSWVFQSCIRGFTYGNPIEQFNETWLYGRYIGTLLMAVAQDGNGNIFPIAFAVVEGETKDA